MTTSTLIVLGEQTHDDTAITFGALQWDPHDDRRNVSVPTLTPYLPAPGSATGTAVIVVPGGTRVVHAFTFDGGRGTISDGRVLVTVAQEVGAPDGLTVDAAGDLWVAVYYGGRVQRYSPDGELLQVLRVPAVQSTSCAFAGPRLNMLFVTTATEGWSDEQRRAEPTAGLTYRFDTEATGCPAAPFRPDPARWAGLAS